MPRSLSLRSCPLGLRALALSLTSVLALLSTNTDAAMFSSDRDTTIVGNGGADTPFNLSTTYVGEGGPNENRALVGFDISSIGPSVASVSAVSLTLHVVDSQFNGSPNLTPVVHAVLPADGNWAQGVSTWNNLDPSVPTPWAGAPGLYDSGTDYGPTLASASFTGSVPSTVTFNFTGDLTGLVNGWLSGGNAGLLIFDSTFVGSGSTYLGFAGSAGGASAPELSITFATPEPASWALLSMGLVGLMFYAAVATRNHPPRKVEQRGPTDGSGRDGLYA